ncbi:hypothetical protein AALD01_19490 [Oscillospiraceae bacterium 21-37]|nr:hypothetical protein [bacterium D16-76]
MGFNYRQERKKFEERMQENEKKYRAAGMSDEQITAMREYEEEQFRRERIYKIHIVLEQSKEYPGLIEWAGTTDSYFQDLDSVLDDLSPGMSQRLTERDREVLVLLFADMNHREAAEFLGIAQQVLSRHVKKVRKFLKRGV